VNNAISVSFNYATETFSAENHHGFLDILLPESMILYNNKVITPDNYISANMFVLSQVLEKKMSEDKNNHKNSNDLLIQLRRITMGLYNVPDDLVITKRNIL